ncbi:MAG: alpha/beta hydrolase [Burkholderiaceae bacterium]|nr:alpha/beta hydrolase [Burkholderiaceae bacterium]
MNESTNTHSTQALAQLESLFGTVGEASMKKEIARLRLAATIASSLVLIHPAFAGESLRVKTPRGAELEVVADLPSGPGPFAAIVLAPGQGYHLALPALEQTAQALVAQGIAVYRFNWAYFSGNPKAGKPSEDLSLELEDLRTVLALAKAEPRVAGARLSVGGKSLGSVVAWRALAADAGLRSGLFLTPVCSRTPQGQAVPVSHADENYPGIASERRPIAFIAGDQDPLCAASVLYRFAAPAPGPARVAIVGGDHSFENRKLPAAAADAARIRNIRAVALLAGNFIVENSAD